MLGFQETEEPFLDKVNFLGSENHVQKIVPSLVTESKTAASLSNGTSISIQFF
jgi:hypothetical protein